MTATELRQGPAHDAPTPPEAPRASSGARRGFTALGNKQFRLLWLGLLFAQGAMQVNIVARSWLAYDISGSGTALGIVALASGLPMGLVSLIAGALADRWDKRKILLTVHACLAVLAVATAVLVHLNIVAVWHLALVGLLQGAVFAFNFPTRQALVPLLVSEEDMPNAIALNSTGLNITRVLGPSLAGLLLAWHPAVAFDAIAVLYVISVLMLLRLPRLTIPPLAGNAVQDMLAGFRYVWSTKPVLSLLLLAFIPTLLGMPFQQFLPVFQRDVLKVTPEALGLMYTFVGVGSLVGSLGVAYVPAERARTVQLFAGCAFGVALTAFALSTSLPLTLGLLAVVGLTSQGYFVLNNVLLMARTDRRYFGRMMSIYMITWSMMPAAVLPMGILIDSVGAPVTEAAAGIVLAIFIGAFALARRPGAQQVAVPAS